MEFKAPEVLTPEQFNALPINEQKVLIAQDVIAQLALENYNTNHTAYIEFEEEHTIVRDLPAREVLLEPSAPCTVCARGALFLSMVRYKNHLNMRQVMNAGFDYHLVDDEDNNGLGTRFIASVFSTKEQSEIESVFEAQNFLDMTDFDDDYDVMKERFMKLLNFRNTSLEKPHTKKKQHLLICICENIIENNGTFTV